jgi:HTH-type transcriptional regulator/antitoxin HigA
MNNLADGSSKPDIDELQAAWVAFEKIAGLRPLRTDTDHEDALRLLEVIWDAVGDDGAHPLASLFDLLIEMIREYEMKRYPLPSGEPHEMLAFLMEQGECDAAGLGGIVDSSQLEAILGGRQKIDAELATRFAKYFGVDAQLFLRAD